MVVFYLDSSAIGQLYNSERGTAVMDLLLDHPSREDRFFTSELSILEILSVTTRLRNEGLIVGHAADAIMKRLTTDVERNIFVVLPVHSSILAQAARSISQYGLRVVDAIHLATCNIIPSVVQAPSSKLVMVSSSVVLLAAATQSGLATLDPQAANGREVLAYLRASSD